MNFAAIVLLISNFFLADTNLPNEELVMEDMTIESVSFHHCGKGHAGATLFLGNGMQMAIPGDREKFVIVTDPTIPFYVTGRLSVTKGGKMIIKFGGSQMKAMIESELDIVNCRT